jgi:hypothetical protein
MQTIITQIAISTYVSGDIIERKVVTMTSASFLYVIIDSQKNLSTL